MIQKENRHQLKNFLENVPVLYIAVGNMGYIVNANKLLYEKLGLKEGSLEGESVYSIFEKKSGADFKQIIIDCKKSGDLETWKLKDKDGHLIEVRYSILKGSEDEDCKLHCLLKEIGSGTDTSYKKLSKIFLNTIPELIFRLDINGKYLDYHSIDSENLAMPPGDFIGRTIHDTGLDKTLAKKADKLIKKALKNKTVHDLSYNMTVPDKDLRHFEAKIVPLNDNEVLFIANDVTERIRAEQFVKYSRDQFGELYDNIPVGIYKTTPAGEVMMANNTFYEILGFSDQERIKNLDLNKLLRKLKYNRQKFIDEVEIGNSIQGYEEKLTGLDGKQRFLRENARAVRDLEGNTVYYEGTVVDITVLRKTQKELRKSEIEKSAILNSMQEWFIFCDKKLFIRWASTNAASSIGVDINDMIDRPYDDIWNVIDWDCDPCPVKTVMNTGKPQKGEVRARDGRTWILSCYPVVDDEGGLIGVTEFGQEVTMQRKYEAELKKSKEIAEKANQFKSEFLSNISHEIRTPLNVIIGFTDLLDNSLMDPTYKDYLESIKASSNSIVRLVDDILDISKIEAGKFNLQYKSVNLFRLVKELKQMFVEKLTSKQLDLIVQVDKSIPKYLIMDEVRVKQVLTNLISNAIKYTDRGHIKLDISVTGRNQMLGSEEVDLLIIVEDSGIGIPEEEYDKIFEPFMQVKKNRSKRMGYGLGLAITKRLVELMEGKIHVESEVGKGSVFTVEFPQIMVQSFTLSNEDQADIAVGSFRDRTVLLVDDSDFNRRLVRENLENLGIRIVEAVDGNEAIIYAEEYKPDLILMDILMPKMDGFEATKIIRSNPELNAIPILALTALAMKEDVEKIESFEFDDFLLKPFHITDLIDKIKPLMANTATSHEPGTIATPGNENKLFSDIDPGKLTNAINYLEDELFIEWKELIRVKEFSAINRFAEKILSVGASGNIGEIIDYGEDLYNYSKDYDVESIDNCLEAFPLLIEKLNALREELNGKR